MIDESDEKIENPEIMIFQIIELVSSTTYSAIINKEPVDVETLKPLSLSDNTNNNNKPSIR